MHLLLSIVQKFQVAIKAKFPEKHTYPIKASHLRSFSFYNAEKKPVYKDRLGSKTCTNYFRSIPRICHVFCIEVFFQYRANTRINICCLNFFLCVFAAQFTEVLVQYFISYFIF